VRAFGLVPDCQFLALVFFALVSFFLLHGLLGLCLITSFWPSCFSLLFYFFFVFKLVAHYLMCL
jgi:hypothetical protein